MDSESLTDVQQKEPNVRLTINGEEVSYALENETTLAEVLSGVQGWLAEAGFVITGLRADSRDLLSIPARAWGPTPVESIEALEVAALHTADVRIEHWQTMDAWLGMLADEMKAPGSALEELLQSFDETMEGARANPFLPPGSDGLSKLAGVFTGQSLADIRRWPAERRTEASSLIASLREELARRIADSMKPGDALARCVEQLRSLSSKLPEVSVLLQTGKDKSAMETIVGFTDTVQSVLALLPFLPPDPERGRAIADLTPTLKELIAAFDAKDSVLIGDLLEYEVAPRLQKLMPLLETASAKGATGSGESAPGAAEAGA